MEVPTRLPAEALPSAELDLPAELPETRPSRLGKLANKLKRKNVPKAPESPPPLLVEQLAAFENTAAAELSVPLEVSVEQIEDDDLSEEARRQLEEVYEDSEEELPQEAQYERRAEVKSEPTPTVEEAGLAASVGQILADLHQKTAEAHAAFGRSQKSGHWKEKLKTFTEQPLLYKQAVWAGFAGACLIAGILIILQS